MTRTELYTFVTNLLAGNQLDSDLFNTLLDVVQARIEGMRPWVYLRTDDSSEKLSSSDTYTSSKTLPTDFSEWFGDSPIVLQDQNNNPTFLSEIPFYQRLQYRDNFGTFCVDYPNSAIYILGNITSGYTIHKNYIKLSALVSADVTPWVFPARFHKILGFMIAVAWKLGVDYDVINNAQGNDQAAQATALLDIMTRWDSNLQNSMQKGLDPFSHEISGNLTGTNIV